jgi:hypothetical protein
VITFPVTANYPFIVDADGNISADDVNELGIVLRTAYAHITLLATDMPTLMSNSEMCNYLGKFL